MPRAAHLTPPCRKRQEFKEGKAKVMSMLESAEESVKSKENEGSANQDGQGQGEVDGGEKGGGALAEAKAAAAVTLRDASDLVGTLQGKVARASLFLRKKQHPSTPRSPHLLLKNAACCKGGFGQRFDSGSTPKPSTLRATQRGMTSDLATIR